MYERPLQVGQVLHSIATEQLGRDDDICSCHLTGCAQHDTKMSFVKYIAVGDRSWRVKERKERDRGSVINIIVTSVFLTRKCSVESRHICTHT